MRFEETVFRGLLGLGQTQEEELEDRTDVESVARSLRYSAEDMEYSIEEMKDPPLPAESEEINPTIDEMAEQTYVPVV